MLEEIICPGCGSEEFKKINDEEYHCLSCGKHYKEKDNDKIDLEKKLLFSLNQQDLKLYSNAKKNLWLETHNQYLSNENIKKWCLEIKKYSPEDFYANFCEKITFGDVDSTCDYLNNYLKKGDYTFSDEVVRYLLKTTDDSRIIQFIVAILDEANLDDSLYEQYKEKLNELSENLDEGVFNTDAPRDVFICYSSKDIIEVTKIMDILELNDLSCFCAQRNLRHGKGAKENYLDELKKAMHNSKCVLFISSINSRSLNCDALKFEIPYLREFESHKSRIEYVIDKSKYSETKPVAQKILKSYFDGLEFCTNIDDLLNRITKIITTPQNNYASYTEAKTYENKSIQNDIAVKDEPRRTIPKINISRNNLNIKNEVENAKKEDVKSLEKEKTKTKNAIVASDVKTLSIALSSTKSEEKRYNILKNFVIPTEKEEILNFMYLAKSNFEPKYYARNYKKDDLQGAWCSKIIECYEKAEVILDSNEIAPVEKIYNETIVVFEKIKRRKNIFRILGIAFLVVAFFTIGLSPKNEDGTTTGLDYFMTLVFIAGVILTIIGFVKGKKKKDNLEK